MKRLIQAGIGKSYLDTLEDDVIIVYHGTGAQNYKSILQNGLKENSGDSYQVNGIMNQKGIWITTSYDIAHGYAKQSAEGYAKNNDTEFTNWAVIFEFSINKNELNDEGSGNKFNFTAKEVNSSMINAGHAYFFNIKTNEEIQPF